MANRRPKNPHSAAKRNYNEDAEESISLNTILVIIVIVLLTIGATFFIVQNFNKPPTPGAGSTATQNPEAIKRAEEFAKQNPNDVTAQLSLGHTYLDNGLDDKALGVYDAILQKDPKNAEALTHIGNIAYGRGDLDAAVRLFDDALAIDPSYTHALYDKAFALQSAKKDYAAAISAWKDFIAVMKSGPDVENANKFIAEAEKQLKASGGTVPFGTGSTATPDPSGTAPSGKTD